MNFKVLKTGIGILIFLFIALLFLFVIRPIYKKVDEEIRCYRENILLMLEKKTDLKISYKSFSPSILSKIHIKGIVLSDSVTGGEVLSAKRISLSFSFLSLLRGDFDNALKKLSIDNVSLTINGERKLTFLASKRSFDTFSDSGFEEENLNREKTLEEIESFVKEIIFSIPFDVRLHNLTLFYTQGEKNTSVFVKNLSVKKNDLKDSVYLKGSGNVFSSLCLFGGESVGFSYSVSGFLLEGEDESAFKLVLDKNTKADFTLNRISFLVTYKDLKVALQSLRKSPSFNLHSILDLEKMSLSAEVKSKNLDAVRLFRLPESKNILYFFRGTLLTTDSDFRLDLNSFQYDWGTKTSFILPERFTEDTQLVELSAKGNGDDIDIDYISAQGGIFQGRFEGSFNIPRLQPSGYLNLEHYAFVNGNKISAEVFFEPRKDKGFDFFIPQIYFGDYCCYTDFQGYSSLGSSIELSFEVSDYSSIDYGLPGHITGSGSLQLGKEKHLEASAEFESFFAKTGLETASFFTENYFKNPKSQATFDRAVRITEPYVLNIEAYFSTDFKTFTYNSPLTICANTTKDKEILLVSFDGSGGGFGTSFQINNSDLVYGNNSFTVEGDFDFNAHEKEFSFLTDLGVNSIPCKLSGLYVFDDWFNISGDYGFEANINFKDYVEGSLSFHDLPIAFEDFVFSFSLDTVFSVPDKSSWTVFVEDFELSEISGKFYSNPELRFKAKIDEGSLIASDILFSDSVSDLTGEGYAFFNVNENIFDNANISIQLHDSNGVECISFDGEIANPLKEEITKENLIRDFYFSSDVNLSSFSLGRIVLGQRKSNTVTGNITANGTFDNPYLSARITDSSVFWGGSNIQFSVDASFVENVFSVSDAEIIWGNFNIHSVSSNIDFGTFDGSASLTTKIQSDDKYLETEIELLLSNLSESSQTFFPEAYSVEARFVSVDSDFISSFNPFRLSVVRSPGRFDIFSDEQLGLFGEIIDDGSLAFRIDEDKPLHFILNGKLKDGKIDIDIENIYWDVSKFALAFNSDWFSVYSAIAEGNLEVTGLISNPNIDGQLLLSNVDFNLPQFVPEHFLSNDIVLDFEQEEISLPETNFKIKDGLLSVNALAVHDRWKIELLEVNLSTYDGKDIPVDSKVESFRVKGYTSIDASILVEDGSFNLTGSVALRNSELSYSMISFSDFMSQKKETSSSSWSNDIDFSINLDLLIGKKVQIAINPLVRSLVAPSTPISVSIDTQTGLWSIKGDVVLRGGEIYYLNRSFYIKQGELLFDENQNKFDPVITARAETREQDSSGESVVIRLSAVSQNISRFNAVLSSTPTKSENEIMEMLGQIASGDSSSSTDFLLAGVDYVAQIVVLRKIETALRDLCNFDIFSIRTNILQNSISQGLRMSAISDNDSTIGNLFNNSTVYIGKYFGEDIYADALLHWSYGKNSSTPSGGNAGGSLVFQPEIGLEFAAPFANIRWSFAPDLGEFRQSWTQATSVTVSWSISF